jgi:hypothetical protein
MSVKDPTYIPNQTDPEAGQTEPASGAGNACTARRAPGQRALTAKEREQRQIALGPTVPSKKEAMCQCTKVIHYSVFFDGTGNNRDAEMAKEIEKRALSNIAKLWDAHKEEADIVRRYIPGVGTPYPDVGDPGTTAGMAMGEGADKRIKKALELLDEEIAKVPAQQKIRLINITVFGFSRGAAEARAFVRDLAAQCQEKDGAWQYKGLPLRVAFAGLFDTVCSAYGNYGSAAFSLNGGHNNWAEDMKLPPMVEQTVHMIAAHEARRRFPLDSTRIDANYPENTVEIWYPGVHSDVGGGYAPQEQGRENTISRFALNHMYDVAFSAGVLFERMSDLPGRVQDEFNKDDVKLREAFNAYLDTVPKKTGAMEDVLAAHMQVMHRWLKERVAGKGESASKARLTQMRDEAKKKAKAARLQQASILGANQPTYGGEMAPWSSEQEAQFQTATKERQAAEKEYEEADDALSDLKQEERKYLWDVQDIYFRESQGQKLSLRERTIKDAWEDTSPLPDAVKRFFDLFSHDSVAHFNFDTSRLSDWRTVYFGDSKFKPS